MNYVFSLALCMSFTVFAALTGNSNTYWLIVSDFNVALWLFVAWVFGDKP